MCTDAIALLRSRVDKAIALRDDLVTRVGSTRDSIKALEEEENLLTLVQTLFQRLIDQEVLAGVRAVEKLQTEGLQTVFRDQELHVKSQVDVQRGKVSVELLTVQKHPHLDQEVEGPSGDAFGGAVTTVQSVLMRLTLMLRRGLRPLLLLDETLPAFDGTYVTNMGLFLAALSKRMGVDILLVTHNPALADVADHSYRLSTKKGAAKIEVVR